MRVRAGVRVRVGAGAGVGRAPRRRWGACLRRVARGERLLRLLALSLERHLVLHEPHRHLRVAAVLRRRRVQLRLTLRVQRRRAVGESRHRVVRGRGRRR